MVIDKDKADEVPASSKIHLHIPPSARSALCSVPADSYAAVTHGPAGPAMNIIDKLTDEVFTRSPARHGPQGLTTLCRPPLVVPTLKYRLRASR